MSLKLFLKKYFINSNASIKLLSAISIFFFLLGLFAIIYFFIDYQSMVSQIKYSRFFDHKDDAGTLGSLIAGTTGVFWSLSSIALFAASLLQTRVEIRLQRLDMKQQLIVIEQQKDEIKQQRELQELQQNESTFNFLLSNYDRNINGVEYYDRFNKKLFGLEALNQLENDITIDFNTYVDTFNKEFTENVNYLTYQYDIYFNRDSEKRKLIDLVFSNFVFLFDYTIKKFKNDPVIYQNLLWNKYSNAEKFIIGMVITNQYPFDIKYSDSFSEYYKSQTNYEKDGYQLPIVYCNLSPDWKNSFAIYPIEKPNSLANSSQTLDIIQTNLKDKFCYHLGFEPDYFEGFISVKSCYVNYDYSFDSGHYTPVQSINLTNPTKIDPAKYNIHSIDLLLYLNELTFHLFNLIDYKNNLYRKYYLKSDFKLFYTVKSNVNSLKNIKLVHKGTVKVSYFQDKLDLEFS